MKKHILTIVILLLFTGCTSSNYQNLIQVVTSDDPKDALKILSQNRAKEYATDPNLLMSDLKSIENIKLSFDELAKAVTAVWGQNNLKEPTPKEYVKYSDNYKSRAIINYEKNIITIETLDESSPDESLKKAIVTTLLMPKDPSGKELFNSNSAALGEEPYLFNEVLDQNGGSIRWEWRANSFADYLLKNSKKTKTLTNNGVKNRVSYVDIPMVKKSENIRANKYESIVAKYSKKYNLSKSLIYAIIKTESDFNQYAISRSGAVGLMQIMPNTAGTDAYKELYKKDGKPTKEYLFDPENNIEMGAVYLNILHTRYLKSVNNEVSKEYCSISAYNGGSGTVLKAFHDDRATAFKNINAQTPSQVYKTLTTKVTYEETRNYLIKVTNNKKLF